MKIVISVCLLSVLCFACRGEPTLDYVAQKSGTFATAAVAGPHPLVTEVGLDVLKKGGTAIDAAVAMQFTMAVVYPRAGNLGGGGFLVYRPAEGEVSTLDFRERAPAAAHRDMYLDSLGEVVSGKSTVGHLAAGVPGTVAGNAEMYARGGTLPWAELLAPAIRYAENGYRLSAAEIGRLRVNRPAIARYNDATPFLDSTLVEGSLIRQPELAETLKRIAAEGKDDFYRGKTADLIVAEMQSGGGMITHADLADYTPKWRDPISHAYKSYLIHSMPPPSSGGVALAQMLGMLETVPLAEYGFQSARATHATVEAMRRAYADRAEYLGDADYYAVPLDSLLDAAYLKDRMANFSADSATVSGHIEGGLEPLRERFETTHLSVIDAAGNAVALTTTLNGNFGSKVIVDGAGFFLNNEMDDFSAKPGVPNMFGLVGGEANAIQPGKRMLSSMTPTIIERDGELFLVLGAPGGSTIITAVLQTFLGVAEYDMSLAQAVAAPRFHHQWLPDQILYEQGAWHLETDHQDQVLIDDESQPGDLGEDAGATVNVSRPGRDATVDSLKAMGHAFRRVEALGVVKALLVDSTGHIQAAADARNPDDDVAGY